MHARTVSNSTVRSHAQIANTLLSCMASQLQQATHIKKLTRMPLTRVALTCMSNLPMGLNQQQDGTNALQ